MHSTSNFNNSERPSFELPSKLKPFVRTLGVSPEVEREIEKSFGISVGEDVIRSKLINALKSTHLGAVDENGVVIIDIELCIDGTCMRCQISIIILDNKLKKDVNTSFYEAFVDSARII